MKNRILVSEALEFHNLQIWFLNLNSELHKKKKQIWEVKKCNSILQKLK